jgi:ketosteroid isomerase-like protein
MTGSGAGVRGEIERLANEWTQAIQRKDRDALESLLGEGYMLQAPGIGRMPRAEWLATVAVYDIHSFSFDDVDVLTYGDFAVMRSRYTQQATVRGQDRSAVFLVTDVWVRRDGRWQVVSRHTSILD